MRGANDSFSQLTALLAAIVVVGWAHPSSSSAQETGAVRGTVTRSDDQTPLARVTITVRGTQISTVTDRSGTFSLRSVPAGPQTLVVRWLGFRPHEQQVSVTAGGTITVQISVEQQPILLAEVVVTGASRGPERIVEAPAAVSVVGLEEARDLSISGQAPRAFDKLPGVDVVQSGMGDYNVNARGFNSSLSRRVLVLQDGRDLSFTFLGTPAWTFMTSGLDDMQRIEMVRGPGSALYGANAYSGVINFTTPTAREALGTRATLAGGELSTLRGDVRHAGVVADGRFGYKVSAGYSRTDTWSRARTSLDGGDLRREYADASDEPIPDAREAVPLFGQSLDPVTRAAVGEPDEIMGGYGSARLDYYLPNGTVATLDGGVALLENEVFVTGIGRVQVDRIVRPWTRVAWAANRFHLMAWYTGEDFTDPARSLGAGIPIENQSTSLSAEAQYNQLLLAGRGRIVLGGSLRRNSVNTKGTLLASAQDDRTDDFYSVFGQLEYNPVPQVALVGAARVDGGDLFDTQFSPKGAIVYTPVDRHSVRFTVNRAFQHASQAEFFAQIPAAAPADFTALEAGLRASPLGPALAGVPDGELFTNSAAVPVLALGNENLDVETVTSFEVGYKGQLSDRVFLTIDAYYSRLKGFVTDLLPGVNSTFGAWTSPEQVPDGARDPLEQAVRDQLLAAGQTVAALGLTRLANGSTAIVVSYTNAGDVAEYGVEIGGGLAITPEVRVDANYSLFEFDVEPTSVLAGDELQPNTPQHKASLSVSYLGRQGLDARLSAKVVDSYEWAAGVFVGPIPARQTVDVAVGYQLNDFVRIHGLATNVFDQRRHHMFGGSVIGRRVLGGVSVTF